jgi:hypothetical protein
MIDPLTQGFKIGSTILASISAESNFHYHSYLLSGFRLVVIIIIDQCACGGGALPLAKSSLNVPAAFS